MRVLIACSGNAHNFDFQRHQAFAYDQIEAVCRRFEGVTYETFFVRGKGMKGYLSNLMELRKKIRTFRPDVLHAHGGHVGALCSLQRLVPVVTTFHGSDMNLKRNTPVAVFASWRSSASVFVNRQFMRTGRNKAGNAYFIPCGVDLDVFYPEESTLAKQSLGFSPQRKYVLFASSFLNQVKNFALAKKALAHFPDMEVLEIDGRTRQEVRWLMNGAEVILLTSFSEGSPQVIKEAMACNLPIVSVDVGDVKEVLAETDGTYISSFDANDLADKIAQALKFAGRTNGRERIEGLDNRIIAGKIYAVYHSVLKG